MASARVFIGNLAPETDMLDVYSICAPFGTVQVVEMGEGIAFVDFTDAASRDRLITTYNGRDFQGRQLVVNEARKPFVANGCDVHLLHLPNGSTNESVVELVKSAGTVVSIGVLDVHPSAGTHALVTFDKQESAQACVRLLIGNSVQAFLEQRRVRRTESSGRDRPPRRFRSQEDGAGAGAGAAAVDHFPLSFLVPMRLAGAIIGKGGEVIQRILSSTNARVTLQPLLQPVSRNTTERLVQIKGTPAEIALAYRDVATIVNTEASKRPDESGSTVPLRMLIHNDLIGHVIGKAGAQIKAIKQLVHCDISVNPCTTPEYSANFSLLMVNGSVDECCAVENAVVERITAVCQGSGLRPMDPMKINEECSVTLVLPNGAMGAVIGKQGAVVRDISGRSGAIIDVEKSTDGMDSEADRHIHIRGIVSSVELAQHIISSCVQAKDVVIRYVIRISKAAVGHVIGKRGSRINNIMETTRTVIALNEDDSGADVIIEGGVMNSVNAQRMIRETVDLHA